MGDVLLHDVIARASAARGSDVALVIDGQTYSFGTLARDVAQLTSALVGISGPGDVVAILAPNGYAYPLAYYGVPGAGRVLLPLNQRLHPREWCSQLERSGAVALLADAGLYEQLRTQGELP